MIENKQDERQNRRTTECKVVPHYYLIADAAHHAC